MTEGLESKMIGNEWTKNRGQCMGQILSMDDKLTNDNSRSGVTKRMTQVFTFPGNEGK